jgi:DNA primase
LLPTVRAAADPITRDLYLARIAEVSGVSRAVLEQELAARREPAPLAHPSNPQAGAPERTVQQPRQRQPGAQLEAKLLRTLLAAPEWLERAREEVPLETFEVPSFREIYRALLALPRGAALLDAVEQLGPQAQDVLQRRLQEAAEATTAQLNFDEEYVGALKGLRTRELTRKLAPVADIEARQRQLGELPPEERLRFVIGNQIKKARRRTPDSDPSPHS